MMLRRIVVSFLGVLLFSSILSAKEEYPFFGMVTQDNINVRAGANVNFEPLCKLIKNEKVAVVGKSYNWYKIILPKDATSFINEKYVSIEDSSGLITANRVNIRAKPGEIFSIIGQINKGSKVKILKKSGEWYAIEPTEACFGWVHEKFIQYYSELNKGTLSEISASTLPCKSCSKAWLSQSNKTKVQKKDTESNIVSAVGVIEPMGRVLNRAGTHKLISDGKIAYILCGDRNKLDSLINFRVKVVGDTQNIPSSKYPVINVQTITACE